MNVNLELNMELNVNLRLAECWAKYVTTYCKKYFQNVISSNLRLCLGLCMYYRWLFMIEIHFTPVFLLIFEFNKFFVLLYCLALFSIYQYLLIWNDFKSQLKKAPESPNNEFKNMAPEASMCWSWCVAMCCTYDHFCYVKRGVISNPFKYSFKLAPKSFQVLVLM